MSRLLIDLGYADVAVLKGGLGAWRQAGLHIEPLDVEGRRASIDWKPYEAPDEPAGPGAAGASDPFRSSLEDRSFLHGKSMPFQRDLTVLFVDMVDSTPLVMGFLPQEVLRLVQQFMEVVAEVGVLHCGDVHDFEGDGALLYFEGPGEAVPAAFEMRRELIALHGESPTLPLPRLSLDHGRVVVGMVGSRFRRGVGLIGPCVPRAARILKLAPPGGIAATEELVHLARESNPDLAATFEFFAASEDLRGIRETVRVYLAPGAPEDAPAKR